MDSNVSENEMPSNNLSDYLDRLGKSAGSNRDADGLAVQQVLDNMRQRNLDDAISTAGEVL
jgi:hypothetical protein